MKVLMVVSGGSRADLKKQAGDVDVILMHSTQ